MEFSSQDTDLPSGVAYPELALFLIDVPRTTDRIFVSFPVLASVVEDDLPPEALFDAWWTERNDDHHAAWTIAGWEVDLVIPGRAVGFRRTRRTAR